MTLDYITSPELAGFRHGFFTRAGGVSSGIYAGLNCGTGSNDAPDAVAQNRALVAQAMGVRPDQMAGVNQVHSADVKIIKAPTSATTKADAMVTATPDILLGILTADCQPVLFADSDAQVIGAAHAGWKGALDGVLEATVSAMETLGACRQNICAVIGPTISQSAYEVGPEFKDSFLKTDQAFEKHFAKGAGDRWQFDLPGFSLERLRSLNLSSAQWTGDCTFSDPGRFFSYRRTTHAGEVDYGRMISAIAL